VARLHAKGTAVRADFLHPTGSAIVKRLGLIAAEDLNVRARMANKRLARHIGDLGLWEFVRQLEYQSKGTAVPSCSAEAGSRPEDSTTRRFPGVLRRANRFSIMQRRTPCATKRERGRIPYSPVDFPVPVSESL
jgi:hypothetical protein